MPKAGHFSWFFEASKVALNNRVRPRRKKGIRDEVFGQFWIALIVKGWGHLM